MTLPMPSQRSAGHLRSQDAARRTLRWQAKGARAFHDDAGSCLPLPRRIEQAAWPHDGVGDPASLHCLFTPLLPE